MVDRPGRVAEKRCALVVIDVQNDFCHSNGALARNGLDVRPMQHAVPHIARLVEVARNVDVPRVYLRTEHGAWFDDPSWQRRGVAGGTLDTVDTPIATAGSWGADFYRLDPEVGELVLIKHRHSGFAYTPLELALRANGCDTVVLAGVTTNVCVHATAVDSLTRGFYPVLVSDCMASPNVPEHEAALRAFPRYMGAVQTLDDIVAAWDGRMTNAR